MDLTEFLDWADAAEAQPRWRRRVLFVNTPTLLGHHGRATRAPDGSVVYGYTRRQVRAMRAAIYDAARDDLGPT